MENQVTCTKTIKINDWKIVLNLNPKHETKKLGENMIKVEYFKTLWVV